MAYFCFLLDRWQTKEGRINALKEKWHYITRVKGYYNFGDRILFDCEDNKGSYTPKLNLSFISSNIFRLQMFPSGGELATGSSIYTLSEEKRCIFITTPVIIVKIERELGCLFIYRKKDNSLIACEYKSA